MGALAKVIGIFVVIVIIVMAAWTIDLGSIGNPQNEPQNEQLNDGIIQFAIADIPSYADKEMVVNSIDDALLYTWTKYNPELDFEYTTDEYNELFIHWEKAPKEHIGLQEGKSIMIGLGQYDCKGKWQQYSKENLSDTISHETGHYLGLEHHKDKRHLMYGDDEFVMDPFDALGYSIPPQLTEYDTYVEGKKAEQRLDKLADRIDAMTVAYGLKQAVATSNAKVVKEYNGLIWEYNELVKKVNCFYEPSPEEKKYDHCKRVTHSYGSMGSYLHVNPAGLGDFEKIWCPNPNYKIP